MNIPGFTTTTLLEFNATVMESLRKDDENPNTQKDSAKGGTISSFVDSQ